MARKSVENSTGPGNIFDNTCTTQGEYPFIGLLGLLILLTLNEKMLMC